jgi:hypothetical protein
MVRGAVAVGCSALPHSIFSSMVGSAPAASSLAPNAWVEVRYHASQQGIRVSSSHAARAYLKLALHQQQSLTLVTARSLVRSPYHATQVHFKLIELVKCSGIKRDTPYCCISSASSHITNCSYIFKAARHTDNSFYLLCNTQGRYFATFISHTKK